MSLVKRAFLAAALLLALGVPSPAPGAAPPPPTDPSSPAAVDPSLCAASVHGWVARAGTEIAVPASAIACTGDRVRIRLTPTGAPPFDVDMAPATPRAFRTEGRWGLSPLLEVSDFRTTPLPRQHAFDAFCTWVAAHPDDITTGARATPSFLRSALPPIAHHAWRAPWALLLALLALLALFALAFRARRPSPSSDASLAPSPAPSPPALSSPPSPASAPPRAPLRTAAALFALALALRCVLGLWGPLHVNGQGGLWVLAATVDPSELQHYGSGYVELFSLVPAFGASGDLTLFALNTALGALSPVLLWALALRLGLTPRRALVPAVLLAFDPISVLTAATESYFPPILTCALLGAWSWLSAAHAAERRRPLDIALWTLAAAGAAITAVRLHPAAWIPTALSTTWLLLGFSWLHPASPSALSALSAPPAPSPPSASPSAPSAPPTRPPPRIAHHLGLIALLGAFTAATLWLTSGRAIVATLDAIHAGHLSRVDLGPAALWQHHRWPTWALLLLLSLLVRPRRLVPMLWLYTAADILLRRVYGQSALWQQSFDRLYLWPLLLGLAAAHLSPAHRDSARTLLARLLPARLSPARLLRERLSPARARRLWRIGARTTALAAALAAAALAIAVTWRLREPRTTDAQEYHWTRQALAHVPPECRVLYVGIAGRRNEFLPTFVVPNRAPGASIRLDTRRPNLLGDVLGDAPGCVRYVRVALCGSAEGAPGCDAIERQLDLHLLERRDHTSVESYRGFSFGPDPHTAIFDVRGVRPSRP
ncbi:Hypothetical protein CAP_6621 [Chondromyces apiculatus DSM 436]|uniref:Glycosyltransferase RgtA/B/C/D-like domain-containing protein n=1 Tax=Chondromyces apiculatus DSM 436 TaxID=1192034 RepID=A0A017T2F4_9BACT|nr:Hypothetical protein CAP_6621 [Chondromyces apiculatus DSM 436]